MASSMAPRPDCQSVSKPPPPIASSNSNGTLLASINGIHTPPHGTQQWHLTQHPAMAPSIQQWHPPWHPAMAPRPVCQSVITTPRLLHPAMAPSNGTLPHGTQQWHLTMAPSNGTTSSLSKCVITTPRLLHPAMAAAMAPSGGCHCWVPLLGCHCWR